MGHRVISCLFEKRDPYPKINLVAKIYIHSQKKDVVSYSDKVDLTYLQYLDVTCIEINYLASLNPFRCILS